MKQILMGHVSVQHHKASSSQIKQVSHRAATHSSLLLIILTSPLIPQAFFPAAVHAQLLTVGSQRGLGGRLFPNPPKNN